MITIGGKIAYSNEKNLAATFSGSLSGKPSARQALAASAK